MLHPFHHNLYRGSGSCFESPFKHQGTRSRASAISARRLSVLARQLSNSARFSASLALSCSMHAIRFAASALPHFAVRPHFFSIGPFVVHVRPSFCVVRPSSLTPAHYFGRGSPFPLEICSYFLDVCPSRGDVSSFLKNDKLSFVGVRPSFYSRLPVFSRRTPMPSPSLILFRALQAVRGTHSAEIMGVVRGTAVILYGASSRKAL